MIWHPKPGQLVQLHYAASGQVFPYQDRIGVAVRVGRGPGPRNAEVLLVEDGRCVVVPRGNLEPLSREGRPCPRLTWPSRLR